MIQEADNLLDDTSVPQDQTNHHAPLQTARLHEHMQEVPNDAERLFSQLHF